MPSISEALERLNGSKFRRRFRLSKKDAAQARAMGREKLREHAAAFVRERLAPAHPTNDGKQTPMRGHPVFLAMHGCAMCCRACMNRWWQVRQGVPLTPLQQQKIVNFLLAWIEHQLTLGETPQQNTARQDNLPPAGRLR